MSKSVSLRFDLDASVPCVEGNSAQLTQVIMNLVNNASDAIGDNPGVVRLSTVCADAAAADLALATSCLGPHLASGDFVCFEISDTGCGMDEATRQSLFDPFFTTKATGHGLGMAAVLGIVRGHGGVIGVDTAPGRGTTFRVLVPAHHGEPRRLRQPGVSRASWRGEGRVLVVDDEAGIRGVLSRLLTGVGFEVVTAVDGADGVDVFRRHAGDFAAVILDLTMPRLGGESAFVAMRDIRTEVPIILMTGSPWVIADAAMAFDPASVLKKPFESDQLLAALQRAL